MSIATIFTSDSFPSLLDITLEDIALGLDTQKFTAADLTKIYLSRIEEVNDVFHAVLEINEDAIRIAEALDEEMKIGGRRGPLHGVPILIKDNIVTDDHMEASSGSLALLGAKPVGECSTVTKLRRAGVVILGKTNLSEWANFRAVNSSSGWSPRGGQTMGAYYPNSQPSGSSSGSAVATSLGLCYAALGTETSGSIISPAETNNVVGLKPSRGFIGTDNCIPVSRRQDVIGPLARTVKDAALILSAIAGKSEADPYTWNVPFDPMPDFSQCCDDSDLSGITIGIPRNSFSDIAPAVLAAFENAVVTLRGLGGRVLDDTNFPSAEEYRKLDKSTKNFVITTEFKADLRSYLASLQNNPHNLSSVAEVLEFTKAFPGECYPDRDIEKFLWTEADGTDVDSEKYKLAIEQEQLLAGTRGILGTMEKFQLDVLAIPANGEIPISYAAKLGLPIISVPLGFYPNDTAEKMNRRGNLIQFAPGIP
ncbi:glutamyl-tRNA amidotransferase subunit A [Penicillium angulare]|uniref:Glutamyl-tRNA amidotransferase subunit A n=1 Tax=Penicillium angulare TaxID=116970 RepID=A0A9W9G8F3_9EURO|nr:glutamyl-tRNA amidotransferase subunit A [Penicillium angulare]